MKENNENKAKALEENKKRKFNSSKWRRYY